MLFFILLSNILLSIALAYDKPRLIEKPTKPEWIVIFSVNLICIFCLIKMLYLSWFTSGKHFVFDLILYALYLFTFLPAWFITRKRPVKTVFKIVFAVAFILVPIILLVISFL
jgi:hypothetical protein